MENKKLGLALGSGSWRGLSHIGVIKSLTENNIPIDYIAGCSIGSIIGGMYAALEDIEEVERIANSLSFKSIIKSVFQKSPDRASIFNKKFDRFFKNIVGNVQIEDLKTPFCAVGSNLLTGELVVMNKGSLVTAMKASSAVPVFFDPVKFDDMKILDGGLIAPVPTETAREMGADIVLGVGLYGGIFPVKLNRRSKISRIKAGKVSRFLALRTLSKINLKSADIPLELEIPNEDYGFFSQFIKNQEVINCGYLATNEIINKIKNKLK
jgi:NTE family protein